MSDTAIAKLYPTMVSDDIESLPVGDIAADDAILFLWVMNSELPLALRCIENWGFTYKTIGFVWVKLTKREGSDTFHFGGGNWTRSNPELCLLATRGKMKRLSASIRKLVVSPIRDHSQKPDEIRDMIVELVGDLPRIELFARRATDGWDAIGDEMDGRDIRDSLNEIAEDDLILDLIPEGG